MSRDQQIIRSDGLIMYNRQEFAEYKKRGGMSERKAFSVFDAELKKYHSGDSTEFLGETPEVTPLDARRRKTAGDKLR